MHASMTLLRTAGMAATVIVFVAVLAASARGGAADAEGICAAVISEVEPQWRIPDKLLYAISVVETGRWDTETEQNFAWPWTVTAEGKGRYFATKETAIRAVEQLQMRGVSNIDVGCMQVNLRYHPGAWHTTPQANTRRSQGGIRPRYQRCLRGGVSVGTTDRAKILDTGGQALPLLHTRVAGALSDQGIFRVA